MRVPIDETHPQAPVNPYGESKLMVEKMLRWYGEATACAGWRSATSTPPAPIPDGEIGEDHDPETHLIPLVIGAALGHAAAGEDLRHRLPDARRHRRPRLHPRRRIWPTRTCARSSSSARARRARRSISAPARGHSVREVVDDGRPGQRPAVPVVESRRRAGDPPALVAAPGRAHEVSAGRRARVGSRRSCSTPGAWHEKHK